MARKYTEHEPWMPPKYELADASAVQCVAAGTASAEQQQRAMRWLIESACGTYDLSFHPGEEAGRRNTDFAEGRRSVGLALVKMIKLNLSVLRRKE